MEATLIVLLALTLASLSAFVSVNFLLAIEHVSRHRSWYRNMTDAQYALLGLVAFAIPLWGFLFLGKVIVVYFEILKEGTLQ